jgi:hypothetical protein
MELHGNCASLLSPGTRPELLGVDSIRNLNKLLPSPPEPEPEPPPTGVKTKRAAHLPPNEGETDCCPNCQGTSFVSDDEGTYCSNCKEPMNDVPPGEPVK